MPILPLVRNANIRNKAVLLRTDFNVELGNGMVADDFRIRASLPTIKLLLSRGAKIMIISHLGRPQNKEAAFSLRSVAKHLSKLLGRRVIFFSHFSADLERFWKIMIPGGTIGMLENLRFWTGEERNDAELAKMLAGFGDIYVNDAFGVAHRSNASVDVITRFLPSYAGLLLEKEITMLDKIKRGKKKPFVAIFGGKKLSDKLPLISMFLSDADAVLTGGGVANTFLASIGVPMGRSIVENQLISEAKNMFKRANSIFLPQDWRTVYQIGSGDISKKEAIFDIGPRTEKLYSTIVSRARLILWNGPMGLFENPKFAKGSYAICRAIARNRRAFSVVGGGETVAIVRKLKLDKKISFVSTGGGAMLEYLAGKKLPGIEALKRAKTAF